MLKKSFRTEETSYLKTRPQAVGGLFNPIKRVRDMKMKPKNRIINGILVFLLSASAFLGVQTLVVKAENIQSANSKSEKNFEKGFVNPPLYAKPRVFWWWLNSMVTKESITRDLKELKDKGFGGAILFDAASYEHLVVKQTPAGPVFASEEWKELFVHALKEADRLGLEISLNIQSGWNPGGPSVLPDDGMKKIVWAEEKVTGPIKYAKVLPVVAGHYYKDITVQAYKIQEGKQPDPIKNWGYKSLNEQFRGRGAYPLYKLREQHSDTADVADLRSDSIVDIGSKMNKDGFLQWEVPEGTWVILRFGSILTKAQVCTGSAGWQGLSFDHLNSKALENYFAAVVDPLLESAGDLVGKSLKYLHTDSWEMGLVNWTKHFRKEFKTLRGYDLPPYLPVLAGRIVDSREVSNRFLYDFRKTVSDLIADRMYARFAEMAHERNLLVHPESGGPHSAPIDGLKCLGRNDVPMGEFWARASTHRVKIDERLFIKQSSSAAHIYGKRFVAGEGPTTVGPQWERAPKDFKNVFDRNFCEGINRFFWHCFTNSPEEFGIPGNVYFAGTHLNPNTTWWNKSGAWTRYLSRCSYLLSQGLFQADVCIYYGDDVPSFVLWKRTLEDLGPGYDYDECNAEVILTRMSVKDGNIVLPDGMAYRLLRLPDRKAITLEVLQKIERMVQAGATIVGPKPAKSTGLKGYPESDKKVQEIANKLWGKCDGKTITENRYGKGRVFWGKSMRDILVSDGINPDFDFKSSQEKTELDYIHRKADDTDIYFVVNRLARHGIYDTKYRYLTTLPDRFEEVDCYFRVSGKTPEIWDPMTGKILKQTVYREENGVTVVRLRLAPEGSAFVVFREPSEDDHIIAIKKDGGSLFPVSSNKVGDVPRAKVGLEGDSVFLEAFESGTYQLKRSDGKDADIKIDDVPPPLPINGPWKLCFPRGWGAPEEVTISELKSWTEFDNDGIKYFSGTASYFNQFSLSKKKKEGKRLYLDLGNVQELAEVILNGKSLGVAWIAPYRIDITDEVKEGKNELEIQVVNLWPNRLIGDQFLPVEKRRTKTNVRKFDKDYSLRTSGLLGPVQIIISSKVPVHF